MIIYLVFRSQAPAWEREKIDRIRRLRTSGESDAQSLINVHIESIERELNLAMEETRIAYETSSNSNNALHRSVGEYRE